jgi:cytochrome P450
MARDLRSASPIDSARLTATVGLPNVVQGLFRRRRAAVAAAVKLGVEGHAVGLLRELRRRFAPGPVWARMGKDRVLLLLSPRDIRRVLEESPRVFASDPEAKRKGMRVFQPDALTISRGPLWEDRRRFTEAVLDTGKPLHRLAGSFLEVTRVEVEALVAEEGPELEWDAFHRCVRRVTRQVIFGAGARDDEELSEELGALMDEANGLPSDTSERLGPFMAHVERYVQAAEPGSLVSLIPEAPTTPETKPSGQVVHWFFAMQDTLAMNAFRALALLASHERQRRVAQKEIAAADLTTAEGVAGLDYLRACLEEALRLWPTTPILARETLEETEWNGAKVPAGTQVMFVNTYHHRDPDSHSFADRFAPEAWVEGDAAQDWSFNHFSHGPQGCPGAGIALFVGTALLAQLLDGRELKPVSPQLDPARPLPSMLDHFAIRVAVA